MADLHGPSWCWIPRDPARCRVKASGLDVPTILVRFTAIERRAFNLNVPPYISQRYYAEGYVRRIQPMVGDGRFGDIHTGTAVHKSGRSQAGFPGSPT